MLLNSKADGIYIFTIVFIRTGTVYPCSYETPRALGHVIKYKPGHPMKGSQSSFHYRNFSPILLCTALFSVLHIKNAYGQKTQFVCRGLALDLANGRI